MSATKGAITKFPADGLRPARRFISGHNKEGQGIFIGDDDGEHHRIMVEGGAVANIIYSTAGNPVDMNDDKDLKFAKENEPAIHVANGSVARLIDFAPGMESPIHRAMSIDYGVVIEGKFLLSLDSGESKIMLPGDCSVNRGCMHKWKNLEEDKAGRMLFILLDVEPYKAPNGEVLKEFLGDLEGDYADLH
ncbi:MAG: hypothetical protein HETSPECPRED_009230 [Heterodermia speciosa]|uniref:Uncharacterized protein n=1 Tax=Heterodermia speciosa TaxID=116794 RepID=A0A8H3INH9_9LECA|nr:MAG: hypothetical protein HETSPECPRED_009230 [Heterodermia speciosa]